MTLEESAWVFFAVVMKPHKVDPPQWAIDELKRAEEFCRGTQL
jgi:hypothetical protein